MRGHLALKCGRLRQERRMVMFKEVKEVGSAVSEKYGEGTCSGEQLAEVVEVRGGCGLLIIRSTSTCKLTRLHKKKWKMAWNGNTLIHEKDSFSLVVRNKKSLPL